MIIVVQEYTYLHSIMRFINKNHVSFIFTVLLFNSIIFLFVIHCAVIKSPSGSSQHTDHGIQHAVCKCGHVNKGEVMELEMPFPDDRTRTLHYDSEPLGKGSYSKVYHATVESFGNGGQADGSKCVALKIVEIANIDAITDHEQTNWYSQTNEWNILTAINAQIEPSKRRHIIELYANSTVLEDDGKRVHMYTVLELGNGGSFMGKRLKQFEAWKQKGLTPEHVLTDEWLAKDIADVVATLREMQKLIIHMDMKGTNLIYDAHGQMKAIDFGGSTLIMDRKLRASDSCTVIDWLLITNNYMCPEILPDNVEYNSEENGFYVSTKGDIWTVGVMLYQPFFFDRIPHIESGTDPDDVIELITQPLQDLYTNKRTMREWNDLMKKDRNNVLDMLKLVLGIHECCPRTFHLITAIQQFRAVDRPTAHGIQEYLIVKCRLPTEGMGNRIEIWPGLTLQAMNDLLEEGSEEEQKLREMINVVVAKEQSNDGNANLLLCETRDGK